MNTLGNIFKVQSFGESHGEAVGCVIEGCPAGLLLDMQLIQEAVNQRKTGEQDFASQRKETDLVNIISGVFEGKTIGSPICIIIQNKDARSKDYDHLKNVYRPGHADYTNQLKYGFRDYRGGGRTSIRITAPLVAAGEIARQLNVQYGSYELNAFVSQIGDEKLYKDHWLQNGLIDKELEVLSRSSLRTVDDDFEKRCLSLITATKEEGDTLGGRISVSIKHLKAGLGEPIFGKLQAQLAQAMFSINTVKAVEFGEGIMSSSMKGSMHNDEFIEKDGQVQTKTNHHGGTLGGISSGQNMFYSVYFKPISSINKKQQTINDEGESLEIEIKGRHDVCAVPRAVTIVRAYSHIVLSNLILQNKYAKI